VVLFWSCVCVCDFFPYSFIRRAVAAIGLSLTRTKLPPYGRTEARTGQPDGLELNLEVLTTVCDSFSSSFIRRAAEPSSL